jgi:fumarate hydratase class II
VRELCVEQNVLPPAELQAALDPVAMTQPGGSGSAGG